MSTGHFPFLTVVVLVPAIGGVVIALIPTKSVARHFHEVLGALVAVFTLVLALVIVGQFKVGDGGYQMVTDHVWAKSLGIQWSLGIDGISLFLVVMTAVLIPLAICYSAIAGVRRGRCPARRKGTIRFITAPGVTP